MLYEKGFESKEGTVIMPIKLKRSESFYIREGWMEKAINTINEKGETVNIFLKNDGVKELGIGSNMVKGLKYWLVSANIIDNKRSQLTELGKALLKYDQYLDNKFSWFIIHYNLVSNKEDCPVFFDVFNEDIQTFSKSDMTEILYEKFLLEDSNVNKKYVDADLSTFIKSYVTEEVIKNPEDNYACPLSSLKLMRKEKNTYRLVKPMYKSLSCMVIYYALLHIYNDVEHFDIESSMECVNSPRKVFNLDKFMYLQYLDELQKLGLITINKTAGLNTVYFQKRLQLTEIFEEEVNR